MVAVEVIFQNGVTVGALVGKGVFERWISLCSTLRQCFFPKPPVPGKHFILQADLNWNGIALLLLTGAAHPLGGVSRVPSKCKHSEPW